MSEHVRDSGQVGRETVLRPSEVPIPVLHKGSPRTKVVSALRTRAETDRWSSGLAEGTAPIMVTVLAEGTAPYAIALPEPIASARRAWPWVAGAVVLVAAAITGYVLLAQQRERTAFEERFPISVETADRAALDHDAARWSAGKGRLLATLARFAPPSFDTLTGAGACPLAIDGELPVVETDDPDAAVSARLIVLPGESVDGLDVLARDEIERMIAAAERGRFRTDGGRAAVLRALRGALVVAMITDHVAPGQGRDGAPRTGTVTGVAYAFDPATGALRCAGSFRTSADEQAFEASTIRAIGSSLRAID